MVFLEQSWRQVEPDIRREWEDKHRTGDLEWKDVRDAYRFGWQAALSPEFQHHTWTEAKEDLAQHWYEPYEADEVETWENMQRMAEAGWRLARRYCHPSLET